MAQGTIKKLVTDRGFGFITSAGGGDVFFHISSVEGVEFEELHEGQLVEFEADDGGGSGKGPRASVVRPA